MSNYIFLGPPGAGKGTMAGMVSERCGQLHISTGDILRQEIKQGTSLGLEAKSYIERGSLVPDSVVAAIVSNCLGRPEISFSGFILDGYPRNLTQAKLLERDFVEKRLDLDAAVYFKVGEDLLLRRLTARRICRNCGAVYNLLYNAPEKEGVCDKCGGELYQREDDSEATARERLKVYEQETAPVVEYYRDRQLLREITGAERKDKNFIILSAALRLCK